MAGHDDSPPAARLRSFEIEDHARGFRELALQQIS
jgi:hypothetical protein